MHRKNRILSADGRCNSARSGRRKPRVGKLARRGWETIFAQVNSAAPLGRPWRHYPIADGKRSFLLQGGEGRFRLLCRTVKDRVVFAERSPGLLGR